MYMKPISIKTPRGWRKIGPGQPTFIVAEMSGNHNQSYKKAVEIIHAAAKVGVDAIKLQTYTPDTITINSNKKWFFIKSKDAPESWGKTNLYKLYDTAYTPWSWQPKLKKIAEKLGLVFFSTPFDTTAVNFLKKMDVPCYKIASYEATDIPLLEKVASTKKPIIISVGFASLNEIALAIKTLRKNGAKEIAVLHCVTGYTAFARPQDMNLATIRDISKRFGVVSGFSDNNAGIEYPLWAMLFGASIIEKHFLLKRSDGGPDARFSLEPPEMKKMVDLIRKAEIALGKTHYGPTSEAEQDYRRLRRSIFVVKDIKKGQKFTKDNIRVIRPAHGLEPKYYSKILGKKASQDIKRGTPLIWKYVLNGKTSRATLVSKRARL